MKEEKRTLLAWQIWGPWRGDAPREDLPRVQVPKADRLQNRQLWGPWRGTETAAEGDAGGNAETFTAAAAEASGTKAIAQAGIALRMLLILTLLTGLTYPLAVTLIGKTFFAHQANGSLIVRNGKVVGSELLGQSFTNAAYFWPRPSAADYGTVPSGAGNKGPTAGDLKDAVTRRAAVFRAAHGLGPEARIPSEMLFASGSGLDPHISPEAARLQVGRVAKARGFSDGQQQRLHALVERMIEPPQWGGLGEPRVNTLLLNLAVDRLK